MSARFGPGDDVPIGMLRQWIDESYRVLAPKKLVAALGAPDSPAEDARRAPRATPSPRKRGR